MILCNLKIQERIDEGRLLISPEPLPRRPEPDKSQFQAQTTPAGTK